MRRPDHGGCGAAAEEGPEGQLKQLGPWMVCRLGRPLSGPRTLRQFTNVPGAVALPARTSNQEGHSQPWGQVGWEGSSGRPPQVSGAGASRLDLGKKN